MKIICVLFVAASICAAQENPTKEHFKSVHGNSYVSDKQASAGAALVLKNPDMRDLLKGPAKQYHFVADTPPDHSFGGEQFPAHAIRPVHHWWLPLGRHIDIASFNINLGTNSVSPAGPFTYTTK